MLYSEICIEIKFLLIETTLFVFFPSHIPLATPVVWVLYGDDSEEGKLNSFSLFPFLKYNGDYNVWNRHYILLVMFCLKANESSSDCQPSEYDSP